MTQDEKLDHLLHHARAHAEMLEAIALACGLGKDNRKLAEATRKLKEHTAALEAALAAQKP